MPIHDWARVDAGVFHDFHQRWIIAISNALNDGVLPNDFYAMAEQVAEGPIPDVVTLERISAANVAVSGANHGSSSVAVLEQPPQTQYSHEVDIDLYAGRATHVVVRHVSGDHVVGYIEIVSPGNKHSDIALRSFLNKLYRAIRNGCHLLVLDLHRPTPRDVRGIHAQFWEQHFGDTSAPGVDTKHPLGMAAYRASWRPTAYFEPFCVGDVLIDMPVFLSADYYVNVPLEETYNEAWRGVPRRWRDVIDVKS